MMNIRSSSPEKQISHEQLQKELIDDDKISSVGLSGFVCRVLYHTKMFHSLAVDPVKLNLDE